MTLSVPGLICAFGLVVGAFAPLSAADASPEVAAKFRTGLQLGAAKDHLTSRTLGFGVEVRFPLVADQYLGIECGWSYKPGDQYLTDPTTMQVGTGLTVAPSPMSVDSRKNEVKGFAIRASYQKSFGDLGLIAGVQVGGTRFTQEYIGDVRGITPAPAPAIGNYYTFRDTYNGVLTQAETSVSPFVGATYALSKNSGIELNLVSLRYTAADYQHKAGLAPVATPVASISAVPVNTSVASDTRVEQSRNALHLEVAYVFRF